MFRRKTQPPCLTGLTREIQARRERVNTALRRTLDLDAPPRPGVEGSRIYRVFASFQGDIDTEEARFMGS
jgi:hypothetical protein